MKVLALPEVRHYMKKLMTVLFEKNYFGFYETSEKYVTDLFYNITNNLPKKLAKPAPEYFDRYGKNMLYATFRKSRNTQWYVFFNIYRQNGETIYLIRYISNNHVNAQNI